MSNTSPFSYLLDLVGIRFAKSDGTSIPQSKTINFKSGIAAAYNNSTGEIDVEADPTGIDVDAASVDYDNATSGLAATDAQGAIDEIVGDVPGLIGAADLSLGQMSLSGYTVACKTTTGAGEADGLTLGTNQFLCRASGNIINVAVSDGEIVGRVGGSMGSFEANSFEFVNTTANGGNPTLKVAPAATAQVSALATATNANYDATLTQLGYYQFTVCAIVKMTTANTYHRVSAVIDAVRTGPTTLTIMGAQVDLPGGDDTGLTLTLSATSGNIRANLANATGETVDGYVHFGWIRSDEIA
jgi:hypothetical protein